MDKKFYDYNSYSIINKENNHFLKLLFLQKTNKNNV